LALFSLYFSTSMKGWRDIDTPSVFQFYNSSHGLQIQLLVRTLSPEPGWFGLWCLLVRSLLFSRGSMGILFRELRLSSFVSLSASFYPPNRRPPAPFFVFPFGVVLPPLCCLVGPLFFLARVCCPRRSSDLHSRCTFFQASNFLVDGVWRSVYYPVFFTPRRPLLYDHLLL